MNFFRTTLLLTIMTAIFMAVGYFLGGTSGMILAFVAAAAINFISYWNSDKIVLSMYRAQDATLQNFPNYYRIVRHLSEAASLPYPRIYVIEGEQPNAFATGRNPNHAAIAATTGILNSLSDEELSGVLAHELAHIKNRDTLTMTLAATFAGAISMIGNFFYYFGHARDEQGSNRFHAIGSLLTLIFAPMAAALIQMTISRTREYEADREGANICGHPLWLASALRKISNASQHITNSCVERHPATAHMFIINPLRKHGMDSLFSTHPNIENRILALEELAKSLGQTYKNSPIPPQKKPKNPWHSTT